MNFGSGFAFLFSRFSLFLFRETGETTASRDSDLHFPLYLGDVDVGVLVPHEVDVGRGEILADEVPASAAGLVGPLGGAGVACVAHESQARLHAEAVGLDGTVRLTSQPVVELKERRSR